MSKATQTITVFIVGTVLCFFLCGIFADNAYAINAKATNLPKPPNAVKVVKAKDGNYYSLYTLHGNCAAFLKRASDAMRIPGEVTLATNAPLALI